MDQNHSNVMEPCEDLADDDDLPEKEGRALRNQDFPSPPPRNKKVSRVLFFSFVV